MTSMFFEVHWWRDPRTCAGMCCDHSHCKSATWAAPGQESPLEFRQFAGEERTNLVVRICTKGGCCLVGCRVLRVDDCEI